MYLFAEACSRGKITPSLNPDRGLGQVLRKFTLPMLVRAVRKADVPRPGPTLIAGPFQSQPLFIEHACLDPEQFAKVRRASKNLGATLNDALLAAVFRAAFDALQNGAALPYPVMVPVDMRRYLPEEKRWIVGNLSSAVYFSGRESE